MVPAALTKKKEAPGWAAKDVIVENGSSRKPVMVPVWLEELGRRKRLVWATAVQEDASRQTEANRPCRKSDIATSKYGGFWMRTAGTRGREAGRYNI